MTVRGYVTFEDTLTPLVDVGDDDSPPPGRAIADELARGLQARGLALTRPVSQWEGYGWEFMTNIDNRNVWFMLQASDRWLLVSDAPMGFMEKLRGADVQGPYRKALEVLALVLVEPRFTNVRWFTKADFESNNEAAGAAGP